MTSQEVRALIDAKIKGQGTNVDAGSVLPAILNGILDLIDSGGGGGTSDAVQYIPQILTEPQQMQARKNQGLYYSEGTPAGTITWDGNTEGKESIDLGGMLVYKIADNPLDIPSDSIKKVLDANGNEFTFVGASLPVISGSYIAFEAQLGSEVGGFCFANNPHLDTPFPFEGATGIYVSENIRTIEYDAYGETIHHIEPKYIKDMYYEEEGVKTIDYSLSGDLEDYYRKVSDEVIEASAVIGHKFILTIGSEVEYTITEDMVIAADDTHPTRILFGASEPNTYAILIFPEDMEFENLSFSKGVWFRDEGTIVNPNHIESLEYEGVTVHQIPAKYIPSVGAPAVKIEVPSVDMATYNIGYVILNNYVTERDVVFSIEGKTINQVGVRNMLDTTSTGDVWSWETGNTYTFDTSGYYLVQVDVQETPSTPAFYYATVFVETINM